MESTGPTNVVTATTLGIPETFNAADYFVDRHVREGRRSKVAIACGELLMVEPGTPTRLTQPAVCQTTDVA